MTMRSILKSWVERYFSDEEALILLVVLVAGFAAIIWFGRMLAPFFTALVLAFLLQGVVSALTRRRVPHLLAVIMVFLAFVSVLLTLAFILMPLIWNQLVGLVQETPRMFASGQGWLDQLQERFPNIVTPDQMQSWIGVAGREISQLGQRALTLSLTSLGNVMSLIIYLGLVPMLVFFMLKDREALVALRLLLPQKRTLPRASGMKWIAKSPTISAVSPLRSPSSARWRISPLPFLVCPIRRYWPCWSVFPYWCPTLARRWQPSPWRR